jgi:hypothetical protein
MTSSEDGDQSDACTWRWTSAAPRRPRCRCRARLPVGRRAVRVAAPGAGSGQHHLISSHRRGTCCGTASTTNQAPFTLRSVPCLANLEKGPKVRDRHLPDRVKKRGASRAAPLHWPLSQPPYGCKPGRCDSDGSWFRPCTAPSPRCQSGGKLRTILWSVTAGAGSAGEPRAHGGSEVVVVVHGGLLRI